MDDFRLVAFRGISASIFFNHYLFACFSRRPLPMYRPAPFLPGSSAIVPCLQTDREGNTIGLWRRMRATMIAKWGFRAATASFLLTRNLTSLVHAVFGITS
jgi:hypothetical protein